MGLVWAMIVIVLTFLILYGWNHILNPVPKKQKKDFELYIALMFIFFMLAL